MIRKSEQPENRIDDFRKEIGQASRIEREKNQGMNRRTATHSLKLSFTRSNGSFTPLVGGAGEFPSTSAMLSALYFLFVSRFQFAVVRDRVVLDKREL